MSSKDGNLSALEAIKTGYLPFFGAKIFKFKNENTGVFKSIKEKTRAKYKKFNFFCKRY